MHITPLPGTLQDVKGCLHLFAKGGNTIKAMFMAFSGLLRRAAAGPASQQDFAKEAGVLDELQQHYHGTLVGDNWSDLDFQMGIDKKLPECLPLRTAEVHAAVERGVRGTAHLALAELVDGYEKWKRERS